MIVKRLLFPPKPVTFLFVVISTAGLINVFTKDAQQTVAAYFIYAFSFYTLCVVAACLPFYIKKYRTKIYSNPYAARYISEKELRLKVSMYNGTAFNMVYATLKFMASVYYKSVWLGVVSVYYALLFIIRLLLVTADRADRKADSKQKIDLYRWKSYRFCGVLMFVLNVAVTSMTVQMIWQNKGYKYPGYLIYAMAAYTFYRLIMSVVQFIKYRQNENPIFSAVKAIDLSIALVSLFALQTAMFAAFGADMPQNAQRLLNSFTGGLVCITILFIAVVMVIGANKKISELKAKDI